MLNAGRLVAVVGESTELIEGLRELKALSVGG